MSISFLSEANVFLEALWKKITGKTEVKEYKKMLLDAEKKLDIERSDENFEKSRSEGFEILRKALRGDLQNSDKDFEELWIEGFRVLRKILKEDPQCSEEVVIILENTEEQKRKTIWRYLALLSIQINEIDPKNKSANKLLEEVVQFLDKMEKHEWKEYWGLVLRLSKDALSKDPKNEAAEKLSIEAKKIEKEEEKVMQNSAINLSIQREEEESRVDLPARKKEKENKIQKIKLPPGVRLSMSGEWRWRGIKDHLGLQKIGNYWLPSKGTNLHKRNMLLDAKENLLADPSDLPDQDQAIIVKNLLDPAIEWLSRKIEEEGYKLSALYLQNDQEKFEKEHTDSSKRPIVEIQRQEHTILIWKACLDKEKELNRKAKASEVWTQIQKNPKAYDPEGRIIIKMDAHKMEYPRADSGDSLTSLPRTSFSSKLSRLRKNPPF